MNRRIYSMYLDRYHETRFALARGDEQRLHAMCTEVASRSGVESMVSTLAMSDAEAGHPPRSRMLMARLLSRAPRDVAGHAAPHLHWP